MRGCDQSCHVQTGTRAKNNAIRVDQEHAPVGLQRSKDAGWVLSCHAVQHGTGRALLDETGDLARGYVELLPVDNRIWTVGDVERIARLLDGDIASNHACPHRVGVGMPGQDGENRQGQCFLFELWWFQVALQTQNE